MKAVERIDDQTIINEDGDIRVAADVTDLPMANQGRIARMHTRYEEPPEVTEEYDITDIRMNADFSERNALLPKMVGKIAESNRHEGAAIAMEKGRYVPKYRDSESAREAAMYAYGVAKELGKKACDACPLAEYCQIDPAKLRQTLSDDKNTRNRFKLRVSHPDNNHFCETNLAPGRQNDRVA